MPRGTLEVLLVTGKGLKNTDILSGHMDPYAVLVCKTQEKKSNVVSGSSPEWNETFLFTITSDITELKIKIMDKDRFTKDDLVGEAIIPIEPVFATNIVPPTSYNVVKGDKNRGEITVGLKFFPEA